MSTENMADAERLINILLSPSVKRATFDTMAEWFNDFNQQTRQFSQAIDRAILGGRLSLNLGFSFSSAYQSAIEALFKPTDIRLSSFCVTEEKGNHPRSIETRLYSESGQLFLSGNKKFVSGANDSQCLYVACRDERDGTGIDLQGRPIIKMLAIKAESEGVEIQKMPKLGFIPEVSHGKVSLNAVAIADHQILKGDGYLDYVKAFRNYEDLHVLAAVTAYRLGEAIDGKWPKHMLEQHISLILAIRALANMDLSQASTHIGLAACRSQFNELIDQTNNTFEQNAPTAFQAWTRDKVLLTIAKSAHFKRTEGAWAVYESQ